MKKHYIRYTLYFVKRWTKTFIIGLAPIYIPIILAIIITKILLK